MPVSIYRFGPYEFQASNGDLRKQGLRIKLQPKPQQILQALLEHAGQTVKRQDLNTRLWPQDTFVDFDQGLNVAIKKLRYALNDSSDAPRYIETVPGVGYRFLVPPEIVHESSALVSSAALVDRSLQNEDASRPNVHNGNLQTQLQPSPASAESANGARNLSADSAAPVAPKMPWVRVFAAAIALTFAIVIVSAVAMLLPRSTTQTLRLNLTLPARLRLLTTEAGRGLALSPDGTRIVFPALDANGKTELWMRRMDALDPQPLPGTEDGAFPFWSPDGENIAFFTDLRLKRLRLRDGLVREICPAESARGGIWTKEDLIVFAPSTRTELYKVSAGGGVPIPVTKLDEKHHTTHRWPALLPDGRHFVYLAANHETPDVPAEIYLASLDGSSNERIIDADSNAVVVSDRLVFVSAGKLMSRRLDVEHHRAEATATILAEGVGYYHGSWYGSFAAGAQSLIYRQQKSPGEQVIARFDRQGKRLGTVSTPGNYQTVSLSPDGQVVAAACGDPAMGICVIQPDGSMTKLPGVIGFDVAWSPDSRSVAYDLHGQSNSEVRIKEVESKTPERTISSRWEGVGSWLPDGKHLLLIGDDSSVNVFDLQTGKRRNYLPPSPRLAHARISPNGKWVAYDSDATGSWEVYLASYPVASVKYQVSTSGGMEPRWRGDSRELYYLGAGEDLFAVPIVPNGNGLRIGQAMALFHPPILSPPRDRDCCDVNRDGSEFFVVSDLQPQPAELVVISHWEQ